MNVIKHQTHSIGPSIGPQVQAVPTEGHWVLLNYIKALSDRTTYSFTSTSWLTLLINVSHPNQLFQLAVSLLPFLHLATGMILTLPQSLDLLQKFMLVFLKFLLLLLDFFNIRPLSFVL